MRFEYLLTFALLLTACGGRSVDTGSAQNLIIALPGAALEKEDVEVKKVTQISGSEAIAETSLKTAFRLERVRGQWVVREIRVGHGQWEKVENLARALEDARARETAELLDRVVEAIRSYREATGSLPQFRDYIGLSDLLSPRYLTPLIRLDAWRRPLAARRESPEAIVLLSSGPDGRFGTSDDIGRTYR